MNGANAANKNNQHKNDRLQSELDELAETLKNLNLEQQRIRIQTNCQRLWSKTRRRNNSLCSLRRLF